MPKELLWPRSIYYLAGEVYIKWQSNIYFKKRAFYFDSTCNLFFMLNLFFSYLFRTFDSNSAVGATKID